ncbi:MAG TPA: NAD-dependent epimerase/dehydratase family protein, partial [Planctomycetes bacterium]|nr:NAD-dependent epimerase/dehydratase family protein [Planctomycetota bacterium]
TVAVYGPTADGDLDESTPHRPEGDFYAETKDEAERIVLDLAGKGDLAGSVIQPTVVYGPFAPAWTVRILNELKTGREILVDGGHGLCNVVYVDDIVRGLRLAATEDGALGEEFLISGPEPVTWKEFYAGYEHMLGFENHVEMSAADAHALFQRLYGKKRLIREGLSVVRDTPELRRRLKATGEAQAFLKAAKMVMPSRIRRKIKSKVTGRNLDPVQAAPKKAEPPIHPLPPAGVDLARAKTRVRIDKARRLLGYEPRFDWDAGLERVEAWARWAGILPSREAVEIG